MINGDMWVRCLRCGKTWLPPVKDNFYFNAKGKQVAPKDGEFDQVKFDTADIDYRRAVNFETNNSPSGSVQCRFTKWDDASGQWVDATKDYREPCESHDTTLEILDLAVLSEERAVPIHRSLNLIGGFMGQPSKEVKKRWLLANQHKRLKINKDWKLRAFYGITPEDYQKLLEQQDYKCAICQCDFVMEP